MRLETTLRLLTQYENKEKLIKEIQTTKSPLVSINYFIFLFVFSFHFYNIFAYRKENFYLLISLIPFFQSLIWIQQENKQLK